MIISYNTKIMSLRIIIKYACLTFVTFAAIKD